MTPSRGAALTATAIGTALQLAMIAAGHYVPFIKTYGFAVGGMAISLVAGVIYARLAAARRAHAAGRGAIVGGLCALIGIAASVALRDTPPAILVFGTLASAVTGALGGLAAGGRSSGVVAALVGLATVTGTAPARNESAPQPLATTADFSWLSGSWEGSLSGSSAVAEVTFSKPRAGSIVGVMRLVGPDSGIQVVELISMVDSPTGPELRFRHFSAKLDAYEAHFQQTMRLVEHGASRDVFENQVAFDSTEMSTEPRRATFVRNGDDAFGATSEILDDHGHPGTIRVSYRRRMGT
jgi:hypothetical protein